MEKFEHILNWKLKTGSHRFPGPDGGTCINEAAVVAAGFEYRAVTTVHHMPDCFSRPICHLAMRLNDNSTDEERQRLIPFVTRLACADSPEIERERATYIGRHLPSRFSFSEGLQVLEGALAIGRQTDEPPAHAAASRLLKAREQRPRRQPLWAMVKDWFAVPA